jgi:hypothetical protein
VPTQLISGGKRDVLVLDEIVNRSEAVEAPQTGLTIATLFVLVVNFGPIVDPDCAAL